MSPDAQTTYAGAPVRLAEAAALREFETALRGTGLLPAGRRSPSLPAGPRTLPAAGSAPEVGFRAQDGSVRTLSLRRCDLAALPDAIHQLARLRHLDLTGNRISALPESLGDLTELESLHLDENQLTAIPRCVERLSSLRELHLDANQLAALPDGIDRLPVSNGCTHVAIAWVLCRRAWDV